MAQTRSIHSHLLILVLVVVVPFMVFSAYVLSQEFQKDRAHALAELDSLRDAAAEKTAAALRLTQRRLNRLVEYTEIRTGNTEDAAVLLKKFLGERLDYTAALLVDTSGRVLAAEPELPLGTSLADVPAWQEAIRAPGFHVGRCFLPPESNRWTCLVALPVIGLDGQRVGTMGLAMNLVRSNAVLASAGREAPYVIGVMDNTGRLLNREPRDDMHLGSQMPGIDDFFASWKSGEAHPAALGFDGLQRVYAPTALLGTPWVIYSSVPKSAILEDAWSNFWQMLIGGSMASAVALWLASRYAKRLARPITELAVAARAQASGHGEARAPEFGPKEILRTARAFNEMVEARIAAESALQRSEQLHRTVIDQTGQMIYELDLSTGHIQWFGSEAVPSITGHKLEEFQAVDLSRWAALIHPEDREEAWRLFTQAKAQHQSFSAEYRFEHRDGSYRWIEDHGIFLPDANGTPVRMIGRMSDTTRRREAEEAHARYAAIVEWSDDAIISQQLDGKITAWNRGAERIYGYTAEEIIGKSVDVLHPAEVRAKGRELLKAVAGGAVVSNHETVRMRKDGSCVDVSITLSAIRDASGRIIGVAKTARDISQIKKAEAHRQLMEHKLLETQKLESLGVLAGGIAHDFNNLLTGVLGNASLARSELPPDAPTLQLIEQIETSARRAADLCRQMLAYSGRGRFVVEKIDLNRLIEETTQLLNISISKTCVLRFNLAGRLPSVSADATQIRQVVMNLVINASEAIGTRSGVIAISTGVARLDRDYLATLRHDSGIEPGDYVFFEVSDNGSGMDAGTMERIFDPFYTTKFTGRGLGLAAVLGIVRGHQGALKVYSEPGRGTTFKLFFPCVPGPADHYSRPPIGDASLRGTGTVLVVDDEETVRVIAGRILEQYGYKVELANDGRDALEKYRVAPSRYAAVLLDLTMPHLDGEETFRQLRHINPGVRVVLMSGFNQQEAVSRFSGKGLGGFVQKPFAVDTLAGAIRQAVLAG